ncbi:E3 ubiquitin-protein like [Actinidia chinensis var. chinensis]|uniref:E3 ubiquitin-protein like n=1 Tax=Actinidia chinensis var. chinensis TaxID=1590841 RepID=A0A2R6R3J0_ACTCC|nr:E3 ubiquitin-protein like [Actinidia chinensis var. chinensis]
MGSACCVARRDATLTNGTSGETVCRNVVYSPLRRSVVYSPSWSFRWDNRRRVAGEIENISEPSHGISTNSSMERKGELVLDRGNFSGQGSPLGTFGTPTSQKSPVHEGPGVKRVTTSDVSHVVNDNTKLQRSIESPGMVDSSAPKLSLSVPSSSSLLTPTADPLSSRTRSLPPNSSQTKRAHQSPGHDLLRQVSDSRILGLKSPNSNLVSEGRPSFVLSTCSNDMMVGSHGGSSDGWSMRTFSELVASSQRERCSFDSEFLGSGRRKLSESSSTFSYSPSIDLQTCGICSKLLSERSSWSSHKIIASNELLVVAVLVCGHVYHAECLEAITQEVDCYDPSCPTCSFGEKQMSKMARKVLKAEAELKSRSSKISRNRVVDSYDVLDRRKPMELEEKFPKMESSSSARRSFAKPFLKRHFSLGSKWSRSMLENNSARKGFWARYRKD